MQVVDFTFKSNYTPHIVSMEIDMERNMKAAPDIKLMKEVLDYDPTTGIFTWKSEIGSRVRVGSQAGGIDSAGYVRISFDKVLYPAHRLAWYWVHGEWPKTLKHLNGVKTDNRIANLQPSFKDSETGYKNAPDVTAERLRQVVEYDAETGVIIWKVSPSSKSPVGSVAGVVNSAGYRILTIDGKKYLAHRLAWLYVHGVWPKEDIDHVNRVKTDNRLINLREATRTQNNINGRVRSDNKSGFTGVNWHNGSQKWRVTVHKDGKQFQVGMFDDIEEAAAAYKKAAAKLHGEFADNRNTTGASDI